MTDIKKMAEEYKEHVCYMKSKDGENQFYMFINEYPDGGFKFEFLDYQPKDLENYTPIYIYTKSVLPALARIAELEESNRLLKIANERTVSAAYHALLEMSAWLGINQSKRISHIDNLMENVKFCADENNQKQIIEMQKESER